MSEYLDIDNKIGLLKDCNQISIIYDGDKITPPVCSGFDFPQVKSVLSSLEPGSLISLFPDEFLFDYEMTLNHWRQFIVIERRYPTEIIPGLTLDEARWGWILVDHWESIGPMDKLSYIDLLDSSGSDLDCLGINEFVSPDSSRKVKSVFSFPIMCYSPNSIISPFLDFVGREYDYYFA